MGRMTKTRATIAGVTAALAAVGLAELVAVITGARSSPLVAVDGWVVDHVPESLKQFAIRLFGVHDKTALLTGTAVLLLAFAALVGLAARRAFAWGVLGIAVFALIGVAAAVTRPGANAAWALPTLIGSAAAVVVLHFLVRRPEWAETASGADRPAGEPDAEAGARSRRRFLRLAGFTAAGSVVAGLVGRALADRRGVAQARS
jgi:hypothetical protein